MACGSVGVTWNAHNLRVGDLFVITGCADQPLLNGVHQVVSVRDANTISFNVPRRVLPAGTFDATITVRLMAQRAILLAASAGDLQFGPDAAADFDTIKTGNSYLLQAPIGAKFDLGEIYVQSALAHQTLKVMYV